MRPARQKGGSIVNAFETLGLRWDADQAQVHAAYRNRVKGCHPDQFQDQAQSDRAQEEMIRLNLAYEEALRIASKRKIACNTLSCEEAIALASRLTGQGRHENALRQLARAERRSAQWYFLQGNILMVLHQYESAYQSYREAVRREPDNLQFRRGAFNAAVTLKKHRRPMRRAVDAVGRLLGRH
jgi:molecular chaperone DnaJ